MIEQQVIGRNSKSISDSHNKIQGWKFASRFKVTDIAVSCQPNLLG
jgi:hypothetical protein